MASEIDIMVWLLLGAADILLFGNALILGYLQGASKKLVGVCQWVVLMLAGMFFAVETTVAVINSPVDMHFEGWHGITFGLSILIWAMIFYASLWLVGWALGKGIRPMKDSDMHLDVDVDIKNEVATYRLHDFRDGTEDTGTKRISVKKG